MIDVGLIKAIYGTMRATHLFWEKISAKLQGWGFKMNDYDGCMANKMNDGKQCTIMSHVDDLKILH